MTIRIGINGFGRIGRVFFRALAGHPEFEVVAINDLTDTATLAHLLKYDSVHGRYRGTVAAGADSLIIDGKTVKVLAAKDPGELPWKALGVEYAVESTGKFTDRAGAGKHLAAGARKVVISAPAKDPDLTVVLGVNEGTYKSAEHHIVSNASCTTNCLAPVVKVLHDSFGVKRGQMTTIHSYTNDQKILDFPHKDLRRARAAAISMIPTSTGAAKAIGLVLPELKGKIDGFSMRVPTPNVSVVDFVCELSKPADEKAINAALQAAATGRMKGILDYTEEPLVSVDFCGSSASSTVDAGCTKVIDGTLAKVIAWYDNEMGYSCRLRDLISFMAAKA
jgi:glyceraldehyde 3-phosphate dehydrogenase